MRITLTIHEFTDSIKEMQEKFPGDPTISTESNAVLFALSCMRPQEEHSITEIINAVIEAIGDQPMAKALVWDSENPDQFKIYTVVVESDMSQNRTLN